MGILIVALIIGVLVAAGPPAVDMGLALGSATAERARAIDNNRQRKHERRMAWGDFFREALRDRRQRRHEASGGTGTFKPGAAAYARELYGWFWWRKIAGLRRRQGIDPPPYEPPSTVPGQPGTPVADPPLSGPCVVCGEPTFNQYLGGAYPEWRCATHPEPDPSGQSSQEPPQPAESTPEPTDKPTTEAGTSEGDTVTAPTTTDDAPEVTTNSDLRRVFTGNQTDGRRLLELMTLSAAENATILREAEELEAYVASLNVDAGVAAAAADVKGHLIPQEQIDTWAERADQVVNTSADGLAALDKYLDTETKLANSHVDGATLSSAAA